VNSNTLFTNDYNDETRGAVWDSRAIQVTASASPSSSRTFNWRTTKGTVRDRYFASGSERQGSDRFRTANMNSDKSGR